MIKELSPQKKKRPSLVHGCTHKCETSFGHVFTTVNFDEHGDPLEVFITVGKSGTEVQADSEAIGRLISFSLRVTSPISPRDRIQIVMEQLGDIGGSREHRDSQSKRVIRSIPDAVAFSISKIMKDYGTIPNSAQVAHDPIQTHIPRCDICPSCHQPSYIRTEHCRQCATCGYSAC